MRTALKISILINLGLLAGLVLRPANPAKPAAEQEQLTAVPAHPAAEGVVSSPNPVVAKPFRWHQLYAKDYHVYVKNLREIGCPEPAVRAIAAADVHVVFQRRTDEIEKNLSDFAKGSWVDQVGAWKRQEEWKQALLQLPDAEAAMLADCLGVNQTGNSVAPEASQPPSTRADEPMVAPLVAQPVELAALNLDQSQLQAITDLQEVFMQRIGGPDQDPRDPAYRARWRAAQTEVDNLMQGMLGDQAYQEYQSQAFAIAQAR